MRTLLALAVAASAVAAPVPKGIKLKTDSVLMEGRWVSVSLRGKPNASYSLWLKDGMMAMGSDNTPADESTAVPLTFDEAQSPRQFELTWKGWTRPQQYIYLLDGDTLTMCHGKDGHTRPADFDNGTCFVFTRATVK